MTLKRNSDQINEKTEDIILIIDSDLAHLYLYFQFNQIFLLTQDILFEVYSILLFYETISEQ